MTTLKAAFEQYALVSLEKQARLFSFLGEHILDLDLDAGTARFNDLSVPFQVLGTESENSLTWLWAWAEEQTELPEGLLAAARKLKAWGEKEGLTEFTLPSLDLDRADGTMLSLIASEVSNASGYYRDSYQGGIVFLLLQGIALDDQLVFDRAGLIRQLSDLAALYEFNHRRALLSYLKAKGMPTSVTDETVGAELTSGERLIVEFDTDGQITMINGEPFRSDR